MTLENVLEEFAKKVLKENRQKIEELNKHYLHRKNGKCMFCDCEQKTINSHSISKKRYLMNICSQDSHMGAFITKRNDKSKELEWSNNVGLNEASGFPGFCKDHDNLLFETIDNNGLSFDIDVILQAYRSVCWWLYKEEVSSAILGAIQDKVDESMKKFTSAMEEFDYDASKTNGDYLNKAYNYVSVLSSIKSALEVAIKNKKYNQKPLVEYAYYEIPNANNKDTIEIYFKRVDLYIPVALQTMVSTKVGKVFQIVLPDKNYTDIIVINATGQKIILKECWEVSTANKLNVLGLIESWMIADENWFVDSAIIDVFSDVKRKIISDDIRYATIERKLWQPYDMSIFDDLRRKLLNGLKISEDRMKQEMSLFDIPQRPERQLREEELHRRIIEQSYYNTYRRN